MSERTEDRICSCRVCTFAACPAVDVEAIAREAAKKIMGRVRWAAALEGHPVAKDSPTREFAEVIATAIRAALAAYEKGGRQ